MEGQFGKLWEIQQFEIKIIPILRNKQVSKWFHSWRGEKANVKPPRVGHSSIQQSNLLMNKCSKLYTFKLEHHVIVCLFLVADLKEMDELAKLSMKSISTDRANIIAKSAAMNNSEECCISRHSRQLLLLNTANTCALN